MTACVRLVLVAGVALVLAGPVLLLFLGQLILSHDALLLAPASRRLSRQLAERVISIQSGHSGSPSGCSARTVNESRYAR